MRQKITENRIVDAFNNYAFLNNIVFNLYACGFSHISTTIGTYFYECTCYCDTEEEAQQAYDIMKKSTGERGDYEGYKHTGDYGTCYYVNFKLRVESRFEKDC